MAITRENVLALSKHAVPRIIAGIVDNQQAIVDGGIDTALRLCHFMAQLAHESAHFTVTREFASGAAYEGRRNLGNTQPGDGKRYRGRGLIQTTGRANYREATADIKKMNPSAPDFEADPIELEEFPWALLAGISYWRRRNINEAADRDDVRAVTKKINGGTNGLASRQEYLQKAKAIWLVDGAPKPAGSVSLPELRVNAQGTAVTDLQNELVEAGFSVRPDGQFGEHTKEAVMAFQSQHGIRADGIVGSQTWAALKSS